MNDTDGDPWMAEQFERLLAAAGFSLGTIVPVSPDLCVIEGIPV